MIFQMRVNQRLSFHVLHVILFVSLAVDTHSWVLPTWPKAGCKDCYHVILTSGDSLNHKWLTEIAYYHYKKAKRIHKNSPLGGFTRILDSETPDDLMDIIPTFLAGGWPEDVPSHYGPGRRAHSIRLWLQQQAHKIPEDYVLITEPDILVLMPPPLNATRYEPFTYNYEGTLHLRHIGPLFKQYNIKNVTLNKLQPTAPSPAMWHKEQLMELVDPWHNMMVRMLNEWNHSVVWGWRLEMFAYTISASQAERGPVRHHLNLTCSWPPYYDMYDDRGDFKHVMHYPTPFSYHANGTLSWMNDFSAPWRWEKHQYKTEYPPLPYPLPPEGASASARAVILLMNEAACMLPTWPNQTEAFHNECKAMIEILNEEPWAKDLYRPKPRPSKHSTHTSAIPIVLVVLILLVGSVKRWYKPRMHAPKKKD